MTSRLQSLNHRYDCPPDWRMNVGLTIEIVDSDGELGIRVAPYARQEIFVLLPRHRDNARVRLPWFGREYPASEGDTSRQIRAHGSEA